MKWITREFVHVDRTACPWLIKNFIDPHAEFIFAPEEEIPKIIKETGAIPFDVKGVKLGHRDGKCSFETIIEEYGLEDPALHEVAKIVHAADMRDYREAPEGKGLDIIMTGIRYDSKDDYEAIKKAEIVYNALYKYCKVKLLREKYKSEIADMSRKEQRIFLFKKLIEEEGINR